jgi:hypothetical protein
MMNGLPFVVQHFSFRGAFRRFILDLPLRLRRPSIIHHSTLTQRHFLAASRPAVLVHHSTFSIQH